MPSKIRRLDNRLHNSLVLHWTPSVKRNYVPLDTNGLSELSSLKVDHPPAYENLLQRFYFFMTTKGICSC
jgi:hypothetical protein